MFACKQFFKIYIYAHTAISLHMNANAASSLYICTHILNLRHYGLNLFTLRISNTKTIDYLVPDTKEEWDIFIL